jgi:hypothetical protein
MERMVFSGPVPTGREKADDSVPDERPILEPTNAEGKEGWLRMARIRAERAEKEALSDAEKVPFSVTLPARAERSDVSARRRQPIPGCMLPELRPVEVAGERTYSVSILENDSDELELLREEFSRPYLSDAEDIAELLRRQMSGKPGFLATDGNPTFFFLENTRSEVIVVRVRWSSKDRIWDASAWKCSGSGRWSAGSRFAYLDDSVKHEEK